MERLVGRRTKNSTRCAGRNAARSGGLRWLALRKARNLRAGFNADGARGREDVLQGFAAGADDYLPNHLASHFPRRGPGPFAAGVRGSWWPQFDGWRAAGRPKKSPAIRLPTRKRTIFLSTARRSILEISRSKRLKSTIQMTLMEANFCGTDRAKVATGFRANPFSKCVGIARDTDTSD